MLGHDPARSGRMPATQSLVPDRAERVVMRSVTRVPARGFAAVFQPTGKAGCLEESEIGVRGELVASHH